MPLRIVQSKQNAQLKRLRKALAAPGYEGLVGIEGPNLVAEAMRTGMRIQCVFVADGFEKLMEELRLPEQTEALLVPRPLLDAALTTETPQPIAALVETPDWTWAHISGAHLVSGQSRAALIVVLAGLQDPGNLGTILRSAEAFGATGVVSLPGTVSAWNPKAVRASAGSVFRVPLIAASERDCFDNLHEAGVKILATATRDAAQPADQVEMAGPMAVIIGNEGNGVADDLAEKADEKITIPCPGPVESLNAAIAASVLLYEASRQRAVLGGGPAELRGARR